MKNRYPVLISVIIFSITLSVFLFNEKLDFHQTFDATKFGTVVSMIGIILNSLTLYFLFVQIKEMELARKSTSKPMLFIEQLKLGMYKRNYNFSIKNDDGTEIEKSVIIPIFHTDIMKLQQGRVYEAEISIDIINIGLGAAIKIQANWNFDKEAIQSLSKKYYPDLWQLSTGFSVNTSLLNPKSIFQIDLPEAYVYLFNREIAESESILLRYPLKLELNYSDITGDKHNQIFELELKRTHFKCFLDFKQIN
ncbi:hypothetical protein [Cellulophaga sp. BC115SP]|uniref:hypothetical protein n=1 Tax=Cellulophaga sp. BC115SP TaxID=2683263 RepID=UPI001411CC3C|nr:hypothetical protein [Cellulophaga sp. BC115SP]NBB26754.1 hypothetical protein [Cellulophaga sp. BC115SP]